MRPGRFCCQQFFGCDSCVVCVLLSLSLRHFYYVLSGQCLVVFGSSCLTLSLYHWWRESWLFCLFLFCRYAFTIFHNRLFTVIGINGRLCLVIVLNYGHFVYYLFQLCVRVWSCFFFVLLFVCLLFFFFFFFRPPLYSIYNFVTLSLLIS